MEKFESLKDEQKEIIRNIFNFREEMTLSKEDIAWAKSKFVSPDDFYHLRRVLRVFTPEEHGITLPSELKKFAGLETDIQAYGFATLVSEQANEKIRVALVNLFQAVSNEIQEEKIEEFMQENEQEKEEEEKAKEMRKKLDEESKRFGENL